MKSVRCLYAWKLGQKHTILTAIKMQEMNSKMKIEKKVCISSKDNYLAVRFYNNDNDDYDDNNK